MLSISTQLLLWEWLDFAVRWVHVITGIAWIGSSFYFIALDLGLRRHSNLPDEVKGEQWQVHGGGFYNIRKFMVAPEQLPEQLVWFKWESYATWLSGFFLLAIVYYGGAELLLVDTFVLDIEPRFAIILSLASLALGWVLYNLICKFCEGSNDTLLMIGLFILLIGFSYVYCNIFSGRAAFIHIGALTSTIMSANVFFIIIPNQKIVVADLIAGQKPDEKYGIIAKQRSTHNNYLTLPVIFMMLSNHYPLSFGAQYNWLIAGLVFLMGVSIRHYFNMSHAHKVKPYWAWVVTFVLFCAVIALSTIRVPSVPLDEFSALQNKMQNDSTKVSFEEVNDIIISRCAMCHASEPLWDGFLSPPGGVVLENQYHIVLNAKAIYLNAVLSNYMPPNNISYMEPQERELLREWFETAF